MKKYLILIPFFWIFCSNSETPVELKVSGNQVVRQTVTQKVYDLAGDRIIVGKERKKRKFLARLLTAEKFIPEVTFERWQGECNFKVWSDVAGDDNASIIGDTTEWNTLDKKLQFRFYPLQIDDQMEHGGFEYEIVLNEKPLTNIIQLRIQTEGLKFYYQSGLTPEEISMGCERPENVVGSYAVYHASKRNNEYKTGKAYHIFRPKIIDAKKSWTWGDLRIDAYVDTLTITIDQDFLDSAVYPVTVDPTFGNTSQGASSSSIIDQIKLLPGTPSSSGTVDTIYAWVGWQYQNVSSPPTHAKCALYKSSDNSFVSNSASEEHSRTTVRDYELEGFYVPGNCSMEKNTEYMIAIWGDRGGTDPYIHARINFDEIEGSSEFDVENYGAWPNPYVYSGPSDFNWSIYVKYTSSGDEDWPQNLSGVDNANIGTIAGVSKGNIQSVSGKE